VYTCRHPENPGSLTPKGTLQLLTVKTTLRNTTSWTNGEKSQLLLLFATLLLACSFLIPTTLSTPTAPTPTQTLETHSPINVILDEPFRLKLGQRGYLEPTGLTIEFQTILRDWRCPSQVECSEAGAIDIAIYVWLADLEPTRFEISTNPAIYQDIIPYDAYEIRLLAVDPYPETPEQSIPLEDYEVTLMVSLKSE
jgi:hypothetical protein